MRPKSEDNSAMQEQKEAERLRDEFFEQQLRIFYKSMIERLNTSSLDKIAKKSKQFCEQINKVQNELILSKNKNTLEE